MQVTSAPYRIIVGIDYSETSAFALEQAFDTAARLPNAELHLAAIVVPMGQVEGLSVTEYTSSREEEAERLEGHIRKKVAEHAARHPDSKLPGRLVRHVRFASPAEKNSPPRSRHRCGPRPRRQNAARAPSLSQPQLSRVDL